MTRRIMVGVLTGILLAGLGIAAAQECMTIVGRLGATDQEAQEGYFAIDSQTMIVVKPGSELHTYLRGKVGRRVRVTVEPERESE